MEEIDVFTVHLAEDEIVVACKQGTVWLDLTIITNDYIVKMRLISNKALFTPEAAVRMLLCELFDISGIETVLSKVRYYFSAGTDGERIVGHAKMQHPDGLHVLETILGNPRSTSLLVSNQCEKDGKNVEVWHRMVSHVGEDVTPCM